MMTNRDQAGRRSRSFWAQRLRSGAIVMPIVAALLVGCVGGSADREHQLDPVAARLVTASLALTVPEAAGTPTPAANARPSGGNATISAGGTGVSLRSDCLDAARSGGGWPDGAKVAVVETGADRCTGWTRATLGGATSWVRTEYLVAEVGSAPPTNAATATQSSSGRDLRQQVTALREIVWTVAMLLRSTPNRGNGIMAPAYLGETASKARGLATEAQASPADVSPTCAPARARLVSAAGELEKVANVAKGFFESPGSEGITSTTRATDAYINAQAALTTAIGACIAG